MELPLSATIMVEMNEYPEIDLVDERLIHDE
jgi:hypothetical protein